MDEDELDQRRAEMPRRSYLTDIDATLQTFWFCISAIYGGSSSTSISTSTTLSRKELLKRKKLERQAAAASPHEVMAESPFLVKKSDTTHISRPTGEAILCAMDVATYGSLGGISSGTVSNRILLFTDGYPNKGEGTLLHPESDGTTKGTPDLTEMAKALQFFEMVGKDGLKHGNIGIDVFCGGSNVIGMPVFQALVEPSGGYSLPTETFQSSAFASNLEYIVMQTRLSHHDDYMDGVLLDLRISPFITPTHVVGVASIEEHDGDAKEASKHHEHLLPNERPAFAKGSALAAKEGLFTNQYPLESFVGQTLTRIRLGRIDPLATLSVMLQVNDEIDENDKYAFFQCIARYVDDGDTLVTRVCSHRLSVAHSIKDYLDGLDDEVVPIVLGKEAVFRSIVGREEKEKNVLDPDYLDFLAEEAQRDLDNTVHRISGAFRVLVLKEGNSRR
jgi:hypothetical protein